MMQNPFYSSSMTPNVFPMSPMSQQFPTYPSQTPLQNHPNQPPVQEQPPTNFRSEYQGVLHGLNCWVNLMYAGLGMVSYGKTFLDMSVSVVRTVSRLVVKIMFKIFGFTSLGRMLNWLNRFRGSREFYDELWSGMAPGQTSTQSRLGKMLLALRIILLFGMGLSYILKRKLEKQQMQRRKEIEKALEISQTQEINETISNEFVNEMKPGNEVTHIQDIQVEEKMEKALDEEVNKTKEVYMNLRAEDFWSNKAPLIQKENNPSLEEKKDELKEMFIYANSEKNLFETSSEEQLKNLSDMEKIMPIQNTAAPIEVKREKICAPAGAKPWKTLRKNN